MYLFKSWNKFAACPFCPSTSQSGPVISINEGDGLFWGTTTIGRSVPPFVQKSHKGRRTNLISDLDSKITDCAFEATRLHQVSQIWFSFSLKLGGMYPNIGRSNQNCVHVSICGICLFVRDCLLPESHFWSHLSHLKKLKRRRRLIRFPGCGCAQALGETRESSSQCKNSTVPAEGS